MILTTAAIKKFRTCLTNHMGSYHIKSSYYGTAQRQLDNRTQAAGSAPEGDISSGMWVPAGTFPVLSTACL